MPRLRTLALATLVSLASLGIGAGLAFRWMLREVLLTQAGRSPTLADVLRPRGNEWRALGWGVAFLPIFWGGVLTFLSPLLMTPEIESGAVVLPWVATALLAGLLLLLYRHAWPIAGEVDLPDPFDPRAEALREAGRAAGRRHLKLALWTGLPGLSLCTLVMIVHELEPLAVLGVFAILPAIFAPWIGAVSAVPVLARGAQLPRQMPAPPRPHGTAARTAIALGALALLALWAALAHAIVARPRFEPLLSEGDFARRQLCFDSQWEPGPAPPPMETIQSHLVSAGIDCTQGGREAGGVDLGDQSLAWCRTYDGAEPARFVAVDGAGRIAGRLDLEASGPVRWPTPRGLLQVTRDPDGGMRIVRIGRGARIDAAWAVPDSVGQAAPWLELQQGPRGGFMVAWRHARGAALVHLSDDLVPIGRPKRVPGRFVSSSLAVGQGTCLSLSGEPVEYPGRMLVLDGADRPLRPSLGDRVAARAGLVFHAIWTALALGIAVLVAWRSSRFHRRIVRAIDAGQLFAGTLGPTEEGFASLQRSDGVLLRVRTEGASWRGFADDEPREGRCTIVGAAGNAGSAAYRSAPIEIRAADTHGIVRGDPGEARAWAVGHGDRVRALAVLLGWLMTGAALVSIALVG